MVLGTGLLGSRFGSYEKQDDILVFASGVSNSKSAQSPDFLREKTLLTHALQQNQHKTIVYFSTCSILDASLKDQAYVQHKIEMENLVAQSTQYYIFRISNVVGPSKNPFTLTNFLADKILSGQPFDVWEMAYRNLIDVDDVFNIADYFLQNKIESNQIIHIANEHNYAIRDIIRTLETVLGQQSNNRAIPKGSQFDIDISLILAYKKQIGFDFDPPYLLRLIQKYYSGE